MTTYTLDDFGNLVSDAATSAKNKIVSLFAPGEKGDYSSRKASLARQQKLAEALSQMGAQEQAVSTAGGITAPVSPMGALARGLTSFGGAYLSGKAAADEAELKKAEREAAREAMKSFYELPETKGLVTSEDESTKPYQATFQAPTLPGMPAPEAVTAELQMPVGPQTETGMIPGGPRSRASQVRMANEFALGDNDILAKLGPALLAQTKPEFEGIGARGTMDTNPDSPTYGTVIGAPPEEKPDIPNSVQEAEWYRTATPEQRRAWEASKNAGRSVTQVNVGPTGIDYGKPEDGLVWAREPNGTVKLDERGAPIAIPYQGGKAFLTEEQRKDATAQDVRNQKLATKVVTDEINRAKNLIKKSEIPVTGIAGAAAKNIPGTPALTLKGLLATIKARIGFDELNKMRKSSPTGAALGNVTVQELEYLQNVYGNLEQNQNDEALLYNLDRLDNEIYRIVNGSGAASASTPGSSGTNKRGRYNPATGKVEY